MKLSVIIPSYNRCDRLPAVIDSIYQQDYLPSETEIILVDDGSNDRTEEVVSTAYPQVIYLKQANLGVSAARNTGLRHAKGEWIALLDSDDIWLPHKLAEQFQLLKASGLLVCHTEENWVRNGKHLNQKNKHKKSGGRIYQACLPLCAMSPSSIVIHRSVFDCVGEFDESLPACEDYDLWLRICSLYEVAFVERACIQKIGGHADQLSRLHWGMDRFRVIALEKMLNHYSHNLSEQELGLTKSMLLEKLNILLIGARKRDNSELQEYCLSKLDCWNSIDKSGASLND